MSYLPHTDADIQTMLETIGVESVKELFDVVPEDVRFPVLDLPEGLSPLEVQREFEALAAQNIPAGKRSMFLGAGAYNHFIPSVVDHTILRGEFLTAYTPYQPEVSQGTLQAIYEYQSMICTLTGMEVANSSHYDGATSFAETIMMANEVLRGKRKKMVLSPGIHPEYRAVARTYTQGMDYTFVGDDGSVTDTAQLLDLIDEETALVALQYPNFFGQLEDIYTVVETAHTHGALVCVVVTGILSLGILQPPGLMGADMVVGEGQALGIPLSFGGPYLGFFAIREKYVRKMPGRLVGETVDVNGQSGYVLTLATREQHIRREKATSNICTNQGLMAIAAAVYLSAMGKHGVRQAANLCYQRAHYAAAQINALDHYNVDLETPFFHEFVVNCPQPVEQINDALLADYDIFGGYDISLAYPDRTNQMLVAVTEMNSRADIDAFVQALKEVTT